MLTGRDERMLALHSGRSRIPRAANRAAAAAMVLARHLPRALRHEHRARRTRGREVRDVEGSQRNKRNRHTRRERQGRDNSDKRERRENRETLQRNIEMTQ